MNEMLNNHIWSAVHMLLSTYCRLSAYTRFKALSHTQTYFLHAALSLLFPLRLHRDDLKSHLLTWIICRQELHLAENQQLHLSLFSFLPLNQCTIWHRDGDKKEERWREGERIDGEIYENRWKIDHHWPFLGSSFRRRWVWFLSLCSRWAINNCAVKVKQLLW